ncbi:MAG: hypothetical protein ACXWQQ_10545 [Pseudobdellovibrio sp.]
MIDWKKKLSLSEIIISLSVVCLLCFFTAKKYEFEENPTIGFKLIKPALNKNKPTSVAPSANEQSTNGPAAAPLNPETNDEIFEKKMRAEGYIDDPNDPEKLFKKIGDKNGKEKIIFVYKHPGAFEPTERTKKGAEETLSRKSDLDPSVEVTKLNRVDVNSQDDSLISGYFRDDANDVELYLSPAVNDETNSMAAFDVGCFMAPKWGFNFEKSFNKYIIKSDGTGYAVIQLNESTYLRVTWSLESHRVIHGQVVSSKNSNFKIEKTFQAAEIHRSQGDSLKYCD